MAERLEEEEGGEAAQRRGSKATYRPESTWVRGVVPGGGGFGSGAHDGERAELRVEGVVSAREDAQDACERGEVPKGKPGGAGGFLGSIWPRARRGRGPPVAYGGRRAKQRNREERDGGESISAISEIPGTYR